MTLPTPDYFGTDAEEAMYCAQECRAAVRSRVRAYRRDGYGWQDTVDFAREYARKARYYVARARQLT